MRKVINMIAANDILPNRLRLRLYQLVGLTTGEHITIYSGCFFTHPDLSTVKFGSDVLINHNTFFDNGAVIEIGDKCNIAMSVQFITATHNLGSSAQRAGYGCIRKPIRIESGCWICAGARILPGVTIGSGCWIWSGAEVTKDCEPNGACAGVPAKRIRDLPEDETIYSKSKLCSDPKAYIVD